MKQSRIQTFDCEVKNGSSTMKDGSSSGPSKGIRRRGFAVDSRRCRSLEPARRPPRTTRDLCVARPSSEAEDFGLHSRRFLSISFGDGGARVSIDTQNQRADAESMASARNRGTSAQLGPAESGGKPKVYPGTNNPFFVPGILHDRRSKRFRDDTTVLRRRDFPRLSNARRVPRGTAPSAWSVRSPKIDSEDPRDALPRSPVTSDISACSVKLSVLGPKDTASFFRQKHRRGRKYKPFEASLNPDPLSLDIKAERRKAYFRRKATERKRQMAADVVAQPTFVDAVVHFATPSEVPLIERCTNIFPFTEVEVSDRHQVIDAITKIISLLTLLSQATSMKDLMINFMASIGLMVNSRGYAHIENFIGVKQRNHEMSLTNFREMLLASKKGLRSPETIPGFQAFKKCVVVASALGLRSSGILEDNGLLKQLFAGWERQGMRSTKADILDYSIDIALFTHELISMIERKVSVVSMLLPRTIESRYADLQSMFVRYKSGRLTEEDDGLSMEMYPLEIQSLRNESSMALAQSVNLSYAEQEAARRLYHHVSTLSTQVKMSGTEITDREAAFTVMLYGETSVGKSTATRIIQQFLGSHGGFDHSYQRNTFNVNAYDQFDSGFRENCNVVIFDDAGNHKDVHVLQRGISMINNAPMDSVQADVDLKGKIPYKFKLGIGSTNFVDARIKEVTHAPGSMLRRFVWLELSCPGNADGRFDGLNVFDSNDKFIDQHVVQEYTFEFASATSQTYKRVNIGSPVPLFTWLETRGVELHSSWMQKQANYMSTAKRDQDFEMCPHGKVRSHCSACDSRKHQFASVTMPVWLVSPIQWIANVTIPIVDAWADMLLWCVSSWLSAFLWGGFLAVARRQMWQCLPHLLGILVWYHCVLWHWWHGEWAYLSVLLVAGIYAFCCFRAACRSYVSYTIERSIGSPTGLISCLVIGQLGLLYALGRRIMHSPLMNRQSLEATVENIKEREQAPNLWKESIELGPAIVGSAKLKSMGYEHILNLVRKHVGYVVFRPPGAKQQYRTHYTRISPREIIVPGHWAEIFEEKDRDGVLTLHRSTRKSTLIPYETAIDEIRYHEIADLAILVTTESPGGGSIRDLISERMPSRSVSAVLLTKNKDGEDDFKTFCDCYGIHAPSSTAESDAPHAPGVFYRFGDKATVEGDCGAPLVSVDAPHAILGFHVGGGARDGLAHVATLDGFTCSRPARIGQRSTQSFEALPIPDFMEDRNVDGVQARPLGDVFDPRSMVRFIPTDAKAPLTIMAADPGIKIAPKSDVRRTCICEALEDAGFPCKYQAPIINANRSGSAYLQIALSPMSPVAPSIVSYAIQEVVDHAIKGLASNYTPGPLFRSIDTALNGITGDRFSKPLKIATAAGAYLPGKKAKYLHIEDLSDGTRRLHPKPELEKRVNDLVERYMKGHTTYPIVRAACKDEPVMKEEYAGKKKIIRQFMVFPLEHLIVGRMLFSETAKAFIVHPLVCGTLHGCNTNTEDWTEIYNWYFRGREGGVLEGDYSKWDVRINGQLLRAAGSVMIQMAKHLGASSQQLVAMRAYVEDIVITNFNYNGVSMTHSGWNPSGHGLTIDFNSICNLIVHVCAYHYTARSLGFHNYGSFFSNVRMAFMGDDSAGTSIVSWFNMHSMEIFCADHNMVYTSGDKKAISEEYPFLAEGKKVSFCKRRWRWCARRQLYMAPLELDSIIKPLFLRMRNNELSDAMYLKGQLLPTWLELGRHDKDTFDDYTARIGRAFASANMWFEELELSYSDIQLRLDEAFKESTRLRFKRLSRDLSPNLGKFLPVDLLTTLDESDALTDGESSEDENKTLVSPGLPSDQREKSDRRSHQMAVEAFPMTLRSKSTGFGISTHCSGPASSKTNDLLSHTEETLGFGMASLGMSSAMQGSDTLSNEELLSREIKIQTIEWRHAVDEFVTFNPWNLVLNEPAIANRLAHFRLLRCMGMDVRFTISGGPLTFGRMLCSYLPLAGTDNTTLHRPGVDEDIVEASQRAHVFLNPTVSEGGTLHIPYNYPVPYFDIQARDWDKAGVVTVQDLNVLQHAGGRSDSVTITVFARLVSPSVSVATSRLPVLNPQMERVTDPATAEGTDVIQTLALKPNKSVSSGAEDAQFLQLAQRKTYITNFEWNVNDTPEKHLFSIDVTPQLYRLRGDEIHTTPSCWITNLFEYYRSDMVYTFQVVASALHRGKLVIRWDPLGFDDARKSDYHLTQSVEVDLTKDHEETIHVGWGSPFPYLETANIADFRIPCFQTTPGRTPRKHVNGTLSVYVVNELTVPNADSDTSVSVNVFAGAGPGFEVTSLTPRNLLCVQLNETNNGRNDSSSPSDNPTTNTPPPEPPQDNPTSDPTNPQDPGGTDTTPPSNTDDNPPVVVTPPTDPPPDPQNTVALPDGSILRTGPLIPNSGRGFVDRAFHGDFNNAAITDTSLFVYYDGLQQPELRFSLREGENTWTVPATLTTSGGTLTIPVSRVANEYDIPLPTFSGPPGWQEIPYTTNIQNQRAMFWMKCIKIGLSQRSGIQLINEITRPSQFNTPIEGGFVGRIYSQPTAVTLNFKVPESPVTVVFASTSGNRLQFTRNGQNVILTPPRGAQTVIVDGNTPTISGEILEISYVFDLDAQAAAEEVDKHRHHQSSEEEVAVENPGGIPALDAPDDQLGEAIMPYTEHTIATGEETDNWYSVLKRYTAAYMLRGNNQSAEGLVPQYPVSTYNSPSAFISYIYNNVFEYVSQAYLGVRGSMNLKFARDSRGVGELKHRTFTVDRIPNTNQIIGSPFDSPKVVPYLLSGTASTNDIATACLDVNVPHYSNYRYFSSRAKGMNGLELTHKPSSAWFRGWLASTEGIIVSYSVGHDFSLVSFVSTPVYRYCPTT